MEERVVEAVDLFCGVGGLTAGLMTAGVKVVAGIDIDEACRFPFEVNHANAKFIKKDVTQVSGQELKALWSKNAVKLLAGCAPCQPFSSYARGKADDHVKWGMLSQFGRLIVEAKPDLVTMENVPGLEGKEPFESFLRTLKAEGFSAKYAVLNAADYGVPQRRRRLVLVASRCGLVQLPEPTHPGKTRWKTVGQAIGHLPKLQHGRSSKLDPLHKAARLSPLNYQRICASRPGGTWRDWPDHLLADCHTKESGKHSGGVYGRMLWDSPAPTMTTLCNGYGNGRFGHPVQNRAISLREAAIFQSFPEDYEFVHPGREVHARTIARLVGNAVPPKLAEAIGRALLATLAQEVKPEKGSRARK